MGEGTADAAELLGVDGAEGRHGGDEYGEGQSHCVVFISSVSVWGLDIWKGILKVNDKTTTDIIGKIWGRNDAEMM